MSQFAMDAIVTVDARGQLVLPKDVRKHFGLENGGKLALVTMRSNGKPCCISLMPVAALADSVHGLLQPVFSGEGGTR